MTHRIYITELDGSDPELVYSCKSLGEAAEWVRTFHQHGNLCATSIVSSRLALSPEERRQIEGGVRV